MRQPGPHDRFDVSRSTARSEDANAWLVAKVNPLIKPPGCFSRATVATSVSGGRSQWKGRHMSSHTNNA